MGSSRSFDSETSSEPTRLEEGGGMPPPEEVMTESFPLGELSVS